MEQFIKISDLQKSYDDKEVFDNISLSIPKGSIFGLIGPNGAGKSTLLGILTGLVSHDSGVIEIGGMELTEKNELRIKQKLASVLQPPLLFEHFSSHDFLQYICDMYGIENDGRKEKIGSLLEFLGMSEFEYVRISKLSAGSRKKVAFCAAVLSEPEVLFLDEPFESIDVISIARMKKILRRLHRKGVTIIVTSHILEVVENFCDDIAILHEGKIIAYLDEESRNKLQKNSSLSRIFESYVNVDQPKELSWL